MNKVAVYGSLLTGLSNHGYLRNSTKLKDDTVRGFDLYALTHFPGIRPGKGEVKIEVYEVDQQTLNALDGLEGHPHFYKREQVITTSGEEVWIYVIQRDMSKNRLVESGDWKAYYLNENKV